MAYRALYRTYRPQTFDQVIGQSHITTVLKNQINSGHVAHAYLFCGSRGTGKTSTAKIFARAVNCLSPVDGSPCGTCDACQRSARETCPDIVEMDAASNNRVDDIRDLIESAQYMPLELKKRVFILDEAHMITPQAFNALLKTLEEPPEHIMFILATTEPQKLPATIISRCQRFDFHRFSVDDIKSNLKYVLKQAGAEIEDDGLSFIARTANGGMRDALSLADQCLSFCGDHVSTRDVYDALGGMDQEFLFSIASAILQSDAKQAISLLDGIIRNGRDMTVFCSDLASHFRSLLLSKTCGACQDLLDCTDDLMNRYLEQCKDASEARLLTATELILKTQGDLAYITAPRALLESMLVRLCHPETEQTLDSLEIRVSRLEQQPRISVAAQPVVSIQPVTEDSFPEPDEPPFDLEPPPADPSSASFVPAPDYPGSESAPAESAKSIRADKRTAENKPVFHPVTDNNADVLWSAVCTEYSKKNMLMGKLTESGVAQSLTETTLLVGFPKSEISHMRTLSMPAQLKIFNGILAEFKPGVTISFAEIADSHVSEETENKLKELFGDKLTIQE